MLLDCAEIFCALDGNGLDGRRGEMGLLKMRLWADGRCDPAKDIQIQFYRGAGSAHAVSMDPAREIVYLGGWNRCGLFIDANTMEEMRRLYTMPHYRHDLKVTWESQTHIVWPKQKYLPKGFIEGKAFLCVIENYFWVFDLYDTNHCMPLVSCVVSLPHAMKISPSGRYVAYGVMDYDYDEFGWARKFCIFDLETGFVQLVPLDRTVWHFNWHPTKDEIYAVTENYEPEPGMGSAGFDFTKLSIAFDTNYVYKITCEHTRWGIHSPYHVLELPPSRPSHLSSDVVVFVDYDSKTWVLANHCASSTIGVYDFEQLTEQYIDEKVDLGYIWRTWRNKATRQYGRQLFNAALVGGVVEGFRILNMFTNFDKVVRTLSATRGSVLDGSYGLQVVSFGEAEHRLVSFHRGLNRIIIYDWPPYTNQNGWLSVHEHRCIPLPSLAEYFPGFYSAHGDPRLGMHHSTMRYRKNIERND